MNNDVDLYSWGVGKGVEDGAGGYLRIWGSFVTLDTDDVDRAYPS